MALPTNNSRPAIPYVPTQVLPNYNRYQSLGQFPPTAQQLDGDLNAIMDFINDLSQAINETVAAGLPGVNDPLNANRLVSTDGAGNISWTLINPLNIDVNAVQTQHIQAGAITSVKIQAQAVGTNQLAPASVTNPILGLGSVANANMAANSTTIDKLRSSGRKCLIMGIEGSFSYTEKVATNAQSWYVFCNNPNAANIALNSLWDIWQNTDTSTYKFSSSQLSPIPLTKTQSSGNSCLVVGTAGSNSYTELTAPSIINYPWYVPCNNPNGIAFNSLVDIWNNTPSTFNGVKITAGTLSIGQIANLQKNLLFASATVAANSTLLRGTNVASITNLGTGLYRVNFASQPPSGSINYNVQISIGGEYSFSWENKTLNSVEVHIYTTQAYYNAPFDIEVTDIY